jgi:NADPH-dependent glutamate synthase beta subunit-like oxidoreductase
MSATTTPVPPTWTTGSTEAIRTGTWRAALPRHVQAPSPCHQACPVNGDIAEWIGLARERDFRGAWDVLARHNPFPAIAGRICHHPCETACNRVGYDESLSICKLERFVGDLAIARGWSFEAAAVERRERVAIVGGGPSGLSAAFQLRRMGYRVTLVEARSELGGLMRHGIPSYRLARDVLDAEIARIVAMGVDVRYGEAPATPEAWEALRATHDAVYVATGAQKQKRLPALDYGKPWVADGAAWLAAANAGSPPALGGASSSSGAAARRSDAARSARRAGHDVTILALEHRAQMPRSARRSTRRSRKASRSSTERCWSAPKEGGALRIRSRACGSSRARDADSSRWRPSRGVSSRCPPTPSSRRSDRIRTSRRSAMPILAKARSSRWTRRRRPASTAPGRGATSPAWRGT